MYRQGQALFRFSWKWRRRSPIKLMERTHEEEKQRKQYAPEEKVAILRRHLLEKEPISKLCDEVGLQPTVFYRWQKEFFENGAAAFEQKRPTNHSADQERIAYLQKKIQTKDEVLAELMAEHVALKKDIGEL
jgi:transposase